MNFFIMMNSQNREYIMPLVDDNEDVALFETEDEARQLANEHEYCQAFGYEIFERGTGWC